jgi:hypothetical protein
MFKKTQPSERIEVPEQVLRRARLVQAGTERTWIDGTMAEIGRCVTHHKYGDPMLDDAIMGAEALLALLHEMRRRE